METFIAATQEAERGGMTEATVRKMLNELLVASGQSPMHHATRQGLFDGLDELEGCCQGSRNGKEIPPHGYDVH